MLNDVDTSLQNLLTDQLKQIPGCPIIRTDQIHFSAPLSIAGTLPSGKDHSDTVAEETETLPVQLHLYLYHISENLTLRDETFKRPAQPTNRRAEIRRAPAYFDLSYLITVTGLSGTAEHRLLADILAVLMRSELVDSRYLTGTLAQMGKNSLRLAVAQPDHYPHANTAQFWQAMNVPLRPSLGLVATAMFNPYFSRWTPRVLEAVAGFGEGSSSETVHRPLETTTVRVSIAGIVLDQQDERPLKGVRILLKDREEQATTDAEGLFYLLNLPPGTYTLEIVHRGYVPVTIEASSPPVGSPNLLEPATVALMKEAK